MPQFIHMSLVVLCFATLTACGAVDDTASSVEQPQIEELQRDDITKADAAAWSLRVGKTRVSLEPRLFATQTRGEIYYKLRGHVSRDITSVTARQSDGLVRSTSLKTPRSFEVALGDEGMAHVLAGQPLFIELETAQGDTITARLTIAARFFEPSDPRLYLDARIVPVRHGDELRLRGRYQLPEGHQLVSVFTDDDAEIIAEPGSDVGRIDLTVWGALLAADRPEDPIYVDGWDGAETHYRAEVRLGFELESFGLTDGDPVEAWPAPACEAEVAECLLGGERGELDTERCGLAPDVDACAGTVIAPAASDRARFASDLRRHLWVLYANQDPITAEAGAVAPETALERIEEAGVRYVGPEVEGMERFDPAHVDVWRHRDPISSGRAGHWYGAYDYGGNLLKIWRR